MAKKNSAKTAAVQKPAEDAVADDVIPTGEAAEAAEAAATTEVAPTAPAAPKIALAKMRGPRGVPETAKVTVLTADNPKRPGSKAHTVYSQYVNGMTVGEFCDKVDASTNADGSSNKGAGTPNLVYDTAHGFISIEGYTVPGGVIVAKPKAPAAPKAPKAPKTSAAVPAKHEASAATVEANTAAVEEATTEDVVE